MFQVSNKENEVKPPRKLAKKTKKIRNLYHVPTSFRFSGFLPTTKGSLSLATAEMKSLYPLIQNVSFLGLRKGSEAMHGWANFANPTDCAETCEEVKKNPKNGLKVEWDPQSLRSLRKAWKKMYCRLQQKNLAALILHKT